MDGQYRIFVGGIPVRIEKNAIVDFFSQFGKIKYCKVKKNSKTGRSLGYAYLTFEDEAPLHVLVNRQIEFCGRICECKAVFRKTELKEELVKEKRRKLLVYDLDPNTSNNDLLKYFESLTSISHAYVVKDPDSLLNKGYGYVVFNTEADVDKFVKLGLNLAIDNKPFKYSNEIHMPPKKKEASGLSISISQVSESCCSPQLIKKYSENKPLAKKESKAKRSQSVSVNEDVEGKDESSSTESKSFGQESKAINKGNGNCRSMTANSTQNGAITGKVASSIDGRLKAKPQSSSMSGRPSNMPTEECTGGTKSTKGSNATPVTDDGGKSNLFSPKRSPWKQISKVSAQIDQRDSNYRFNRNHFDLSTINGRINLATRFAWYNPHC